MKKIIYLLFSILLVSNIALSNEVQTKITSDEEIMQAIEKFNFPQEEKQKIFEETKSKLEELYDPNNANNIINNPNVLPDIQKTDRNLEIEKPKLKDNPKKYTNHPPLTRRSK